LPCPRCGRGRAGSRVRVASGCARHRSVDPWPFVRFENCLCAVASASRPPCPGLAPAADVPCRGSSFAAATVRTAVGSTPWGSPWPSTAVPCVDVRRRAMPSRAFLCPRCPLCRRRVSFQLTAAVAPRFNWSCPQLRWVASNLSRPSYQPVALSCVPISKGRALGPLRPEALRRRLSSPPKQLGQIPRTTSPPFRRLSPCSPYPKPYRRSASRGAAVPLPCSAALIARTWPAWPEPPPIASSRLPVPW